MKKWQLSIVFVFIAILLVACGKSEAKDKTVKIGIRSSELKTWEYVKKQAAKENINIKLVNFSAQYDPDQALAEHEIDLNAFQHVAYLDLFNQKNKTDIVPIGTTIMAPLGLYSKKYHSIDDIKDGAQIAVPNDPSNWGRALLLLQENGLLTVTDNFDGNGGEDRIKDNPKHLKIVPVDAATTPRVMEDTDFAIINNGIAVEAGLLLKDAIIYESKTAKPFINVIAANKKDANNKVYKKIVDIYQRKETAKYIEKTYSGNFIPVKMSLDELSTWKDAYKAK